MLRTGHSTSSGVRAYKAVTKQLKEVTSDVLNGVPVKKPRLQDRDTPDVQCVGIDNAEPMCSGAIAKKYVDNADSKCGNPPLVPTMNFGGATGFTINFNYGK